MFRAYLLSIIRSLNTVFTAIGICHASYVDSLLTRSGCSIPTSLADLYSKNASFYKAVGSFMVLLFSISENYGLMMTTLSSRKM